MRPGISPSGFHKMMTRGRKKDEIWGQTAISYAEEVVMRIIGVEVDQYVSYDMQRGIDLEPVAVKAYEAEKFVQVTGRDPRERITHPDYDFISGEVDGLVGDDGIIEVKAPNEANHFKNLLDGSQIETYKWQIQGYLWLTDRKWCDFVSFNERFPQPYQISINRVVRDDDMIDQLEERSIAFWNELVQPLIQKIEQL